MVAVEISQHNFYIPTNCLMFLLLEKFKDTVDLNKMY